jgi:poly [ADP-ribose] polymerase
VLKELSDLIDDQSLAASMYETTVAQATENLSNAYYSTIPHSFGRNRPPIINSNEMLKREIELLESLTDLKEADLIIKKKPTADVHPLDSRYKGLGMQEMAPVDRSSGEFTGVSEYLTKTCGATHSVNYEVLDVFRIQREGEEDRFKKSGYSKIPSDRRLLW